MKIQEELNYCLNCKTKPCKANCPLENDIPEVINLIKQEKYEEAYDVLTETTVLSSVCGRICPHMKQCEGKCTRRIKAKPVDIGSIEAFLSDLAIEKGFKIKKEDCYNENKAKNKKVAIIGAGPAGLTCAAFLAKAGVAVTIYEKYEKAGGILAHGIPDFRLDKNVVNKTINNILSLGIEIKYNCELGRNLEITDLMKQYDAIFLSFGANISTKMNIEGEELVGVFGANEVLEKNLNIDYKNKKVAVIGGGNVAMDIARTAKRKGANEVYVIYRRAEEQMPAERKEIEDAKKEGINFLFQNNILKIISNKENKNIEKIECIHTELVKKEGEERLSPVNIANSNYFINADLVFMAVGSKVDENIVNKLNLETNKYGNIKVDENYKTSNNKIFAGGDLIGEKSTVAWAASTGRQAAKHIIASIYQ